MAETSPDLWNGDVSLIDDHEAVELSPVDGMLRRVIVCCDCGLVHLMSVDAGARRAYFVREDGPRSEYIRARGRAAGHFFPREKFDIDADHELAQWREKWTATVDTYSSLLEKSREQVRALEAERDAAIRGGELAAKVSLNLSSELQPLREQARALAEALRVLVVDDADIYSPAWYAARRKGRKLLASWDTSQKESR